ncbi:unnamed protein product [Caenorhabditis nigoni]
MENNEEKKSDPIPDATSVPMTSPPSEQVVAPSAESIAADGEQNPEVKESVTVEEVLESLQEMQETADLLFGAQDPNVCTFPEGYKPRQTVFACITCTPAPQMAGVCYGCSLNCHDGHEIVELYTKRKFRCDCGNPKFGAEKKCTLYEEKPKENEFNVYNHNYHGKFCTCDAYYPDDAHGFELYQCEICEDWYHDSHTPSKSIRYETELEPEEKEPAAAICAGCIKKIPFVAHIPEGKDVFCHSKLTSEQLIVPEELANMSIMVSHFRERLCKCSGCTRVYDLADCEFLLDNEDDMATFEDEARKKVASEQKTEGEEMRELVKEVGMDGARVFYEGLNEFKRKFAEFVNKKAEEGNLITEDDIKQFREELMDGQERKRPRLE